MDSIIGKIGIIVAIFVAMVIFLFAGIAIMMGVTSYRGNSPSMVRLAPLFVFGYFLIALYSLNRLYREF